jgi:hypothetical protein
MNKFSVILLTLILIISDASVYAQYWRRDRYEASLGIGTTHFYGDMGGTEDAGNALGFKDIQIKFTRMSFALGARYKVYNDMAVKMNLIYGLFTSNDEGSRNDERDFNFSSTIFETSFQFEYYILSEGRSRTSSAIFNRRGMINNYSTLNAYVFTGIGFAYFNPKPKDNFENWFVDNFNNFGLVFPIGFGLKYPIDSNWSLGFELGRRFTTTDYIDGYHKPEVSKHNDTYYFGVLNAIYKIRANRKGLPMLRRRGFQP